MPRQATSPAHDSPHSDSSDSDDDFLRLAPESARRKAGLIKPTSPGRQQGTQVEKTTKALQKASRKANFVVSGQNATQRRLQATKAALDARNRSLEVDVDGHPHGKTIFEGPADDEVEIPELAFQVAPSDVQEIYREGYTYVQQWRWKAATDEWEKIIATKYDEEGAANFGGDDEAATLEWLLPLHAQLAHAYKKQGLLRLALTCYGRIRHAIEASRVASTAKDRSDFVADALYQMSMIYHELGDIEHAMECTEEANALLLQYMGSCSDSPEEAARVQALHRDRQLSKMLKDAACGDFGAVDDTLSKLENLEESTVSLDDLGQFVDPTTGATFLMAAAGCAHMPLLTKLCTETVTGDRKAQLEVRDGAGNTALAWACKFGQVLSIQYLLELGAAFQALNKAELKTWPKASLQCIQEHLVTRKKEKATHDNDLAPPPPLPKKSQLYKPLVPVDQPNAKLTTTMKPITTTSTPVRVQSSATTIAPTGFNAAPPSAAAASGALVGRELQAWTPDDDDQDAGGLEGDGGGDAEWDQFEANKRLFGVKSDFDESVYTTTLHKETISAEKERAAEALAKEILGKRSANKHVNEERGVDDETYDPEARYGAVLGSGAYAAAGHTVEKDAFSDRAVLLKQTKK
ncbi:Aste57867_22319 [Aphanomyces stellatus]|uniref:Aste57867_22319 protein n=1 Tax=Aphanomyces stellatus TaxID=120398 RepID=A0A485LKM5_9STRA|nr:hypothetical protein As57867_022249 [Aphanomyces stellatus]VFT98983.1 Aste57867_22319 [Aphanomyces stellatus]